MDDMYYEDHEEELVWDDNMSKEDKRGIRRKLTAHKKKSLLKRATNMCNENADESDIRRLAFNSHPRKRRKWLKRHEKKTTRKYDLQEVYNGSMYKKIYPYRCLLCD